MKAHVRWISPPRLHSLSPHEDLMSGWKLDRSVQPVSGWHGGSKQGLRALREFVDERLADYPEARNHPEQNGTSQLSPYLHFGHVGPLTVALAVQDSDAPARAKDAFLEQVIVRRELAINFVRFNPDLRLHGMSGTVGQALPVRACARPANRSFTARNNWSRA